MTWTWEEFLALPAEMPTVDIHCVTKWSKLDTQLEGRVGRHAAGGRRAPRSEYLTAFSDGGYTTNLPLADVTDGQAWVAYEFDGEPLESRARRSRAAAGAAPVLLEERQVGARAAAHARRRARVLGELRLPQPRRSVAGAALPGRLTWQLAHVVELVEETPRTKSLVLDAARLARPPRRPARRRPADRGGRLSGGAQLLDRVGARGLPARADRRAAR